TGPCRAGSRDAAPTAAGAAARVKLAAAASKSDFMMSSQVGRLSGAALARTLAAKATARRGCGWTRRLFQMERPAQACAGTNAGAVIRFQLARLALALYSACISGVSTS